MARLLITLLMCVFVSVSQVWTLKYKSSWYGPPLGENIPRFTLLEKSLTECLNACALRPWCEVFGYHRYGLCEIYFENISSEQTQCNREDCQEQDQSMMFVKRKDLTTKNKQKCDDTCPYDSTKPLQRCDLTSVTSEKCPIDACPPFDNADPNGKILGNTHEPGHTRRLLCNLGFRPLDPNNVTSECQNGRWTKVTTCVKVCLPFENKSNGKIVGDSAFEGAARTLKCNQNYSPRDTTNVVSRCANGQWSVITECVKDCLPFIKPKNGTVEGDAFNVGATRTLQCDKDYKPLSTSKIKSVCDNGMWSSITRCVPEKNHLFEFDQSIYLFTNMSTSFDTAVEFCTGYDGHVITIDDEKEQEWVNEKASIVPDLELFWLGITDPNKDRHKDNSNFRRKHDQVLVSYYHWASDQPNNYEKNQQCVRVQKTPELWFWNDYDCEDKFWVVCELHN